MHIKHIKRLRAFTMTEIVVIVTTIVIVSVFAIARIGDSREKALQARAREDARQLQVAYERSMLANAPYLTNESVPLFATNAFRNGLTSKMPATESLSRIQLSTNTFITNNTAMFMAGEVIAFNNNNNSNPLNGTNDAIIPPSGGAVPIVTFTLPVDAGTYYSGQSVPINVTVGSSYTITQVEFQDNGSIIGAAGASPYSLSHVFSAGAHTITATATANQGQTGVATRNITVTQSAPPNITLTATPNAGTYPLNTSVALAATASAMQGSISKIELYQDGTILQTVNSGSLNTSWSTATAGTYNFYAKAYDTMGQTSDSSTLGFTVLEYPTITLNSPATTTVAYRSGTQFDVSVTGARASDITTVEFYLDGTLFDTSTTLPNFYYSTHGAPIWYRAPSSGDHLFYAKGYGNNYVVYSATNTITVAANVAPTVVWSTPATGGNYPYGYSFSQLIATPSDANYGSPANDVRVNLYDIFNGTTNTIATGLFPLSWPVLNYNVTSVGTHTFRAIAQDPEGLYSTPADITIEIAANQAPVLTVTAPTVATAIYAGLPTPVTGTITDEVNPVNVHLGVLQGNTTIYTNNTASGSFSTTWTPASAGAYTLTFLATDSQGLIRTNTSTVTVLSNPPPVIALSPTPNATVAPGVTVFTATATDNEGDAITGTALYINGGLAGSNATASVTVSSNLAVGTYTIYATATTANGTGILQLAV